MPQFERNVYEPGEDVRVFDGSEDEDVEGSRLPLLIVLALLVLAMFGGVVWLAYTQGVARGRTETPVLTAANGPARVAPTNGGGVEQPYKGFKIYEQPAPPDDDVATKDASAKDSMIKSGPPAAAPSKPEAALLKPAEPVAPVEATKPAPAPVAKPVEVAKLTPPPAAKPAITTPPPAAAKPAALKPAAAAPAPKAAAAQPAPLMIGPATAPPRSLATAAPAPAKPVPVAVAPAKPAAAAGGTYILQIGAYKSQDDADAAWKAYKAKHAALLSGYGPDVQQADLGEKGTWYRLRIAGFADRDVASALCDRLKADSGACFLGK